VAGKSYERELRRGLTEAIAKLRQIDGFVLHSFNIWTDPAAGVSAFSADTRRNSDRFVRKTNAWQRAEAKRLRSRGDLELADLADRPLTRTDNPADFEYRSIIKIEHSCWQRLLLRLRGWDLVEDVLMRLRDEAAILIAQSLSTEPDAEVSIGTRHDWYDRPIPIPKQ
jgi:hypothetical protein